MYYFCTLFDHYYAAKGLALVRSLEDTCREYTLFILCLSGEVYQILSRRDLKNVILIPLANMEEEDPALLVAKKNRSLVEYYFTSKPFLLIHILNHYPMVNLLTYVDSDIFFYRDPDPLFNEMRDYSIGLTPHRFPRNFRSLSSYGGYNSGYMSFRRDSSGVACLDWYRQKCLEWCYDRREENRYADQKYLDLFATRFPGVKEIEHQGANLAPWNISNHTLTKKSHQVYVGHDPLIFFHFHGFNRMFGNLYDSGLVPYKTKVTDLIRDSIYRPYIHCLRDIERTLKEEGNLPSFRDIRYGSRFWINIKKVIKVFYNRAFIYYPNPVH